VWSRARKRESRKIIKGSCWTCPHNSKGILKKSPKGGKQQRVFLKFRVSYPRTGSIVIAGEGMKEKGKKSGDGSFSVVSRQAR